MGSSEHEVDEQWGDGRTCCVLDRDDVCMCSPTAPVCNAYAYVKFFLGVYSGVGWSVGYLRTRIRVEIRAEVVRS